jgi:hypothetical protein
MKTIASAALAAVIGATGFLPADPASSQERRWRDRDRYIERYCSSRFDDDCRDWRGNRGRWNDDRYRDWYRRHHRDSNDAAAAALFGLGVGALLGGTVTGAITGGGAGVDRTDHVARCAARYRSYDPASDSFMGYDGIRRRCNL